MIVAFPCPAAAPEPNRWAARPIPRAEHFENIMSNLRLRQGFIFVIIIIIVFIGYGLLQYPLIIGESGVSSILFPVFMLLLYGVAAVWGTYRPSQAHNDALMSGTAFGLAVGAIFIITITTENFVNVSSQIISISTLGFMLIIFLLFASAGWHGAKKSGQMRLGVFTSVWSAITGVLIALIFGFAINFLFTQRLEQNLQTSAEYFRSGSHDLETFTFWNTLDSASSHLFEVPIIAAVLGTLGSLISLGFSQLRKIFKRSSA